MAERVRGWLTVGYAGLSMAFFFGISLPVMVLTGSGAFPMWLARKAWAPSCLWIAGVRLDIRRLAALPDGPAIFAANHESALDILAVVRAIPRGVRFVAKRELFRIPVFGWYLRLGGHVEVDRRDRARAIASLGAAAEKVRAGTSLVVFPEGTRSPDGRIQPFKQGPFVIASRSGVPVVPVAVSGAADVNPKARIAVRPGTIRVSIGPAVLPADFPDKLDLLAEVRRRIVEMHRQGGGLGGDLSRPVARRGVEGGEDG
jgi:1-acyl-sn-glycerol-3-phosphate acyltransferase